MLTAMIVVNIILLAILAFVLVWYIRTRRFKPTQDKKLQLERLNKDLEPAGFAYEPKGDYFYSRMNCWQRETGYCKLYDEGAPLFNMIMDCEPVTFSYGGKRWLIELWKGQYGITTGGEIGIYNTRRGDVSSDKFTGTFYENIPDSERMPLSFVLRKEGKVLLRRKALHWWLTGFRLGEFSSPGSLTMDARIVFPSQEMCRAFVGGLQKIGYRPKEYSVRGTTVKIRYARPHTPQPSTQTGPQRTIAQRANANNCNLFEFVTGKYDYTPDKLEYLKSAIPELYQLFFASLYAKPFYAAFDWIKDLLPGVEDDGKPGPEPIPPAPPCPPEPPCCPSEPPCCPPEPPCCPPDCCGNPLRKG